MTGGRCGSSNALSDGINVDARQGSICHAVWPACVASARANRSASVAHLASSQTKQRLTSVCMGGCG